MEVATVLADTKRKDKVDISGIIDANSTVLYGFCRNITYCKEDAEDLFQETWFHVLGNLKKLETAQSLQSFLCQSALYLWKSQQRKYARRAKIAPMVPLDFSVKSSENLEEDMFRQTEIEGVQKLVGKLPEKFRIPLILYYSLEMDVETIGKILKIPTGTVKSRLYKARQEIKKGWQKHDR